MRRAELLAVALAGCAHAVAPVAVEVGPPAPVSGTPAKACWVEYARSGPFTASGLVVHVPAGVVLVDAGQATGFAEHLADVSDGRGWLKAVPGALTPKLPASEVLAAAGVKPDAVLAFVPTHAHSDHLGGLMDLPPLPVRLHPAELDLLAAVAGGEAEAFNVLPAQARRVLHDAQGLAFAERPTLSFPRHADLMGDGRVLVVPLEGHTPGSVGVLVDAGAARLLHAGDAINTRDQLDALRGKGPLLHRTDADIGAADAQVAHLAALHAADPGLLILPAHERAAWVAVFGEPGGCVGG